MIDRATRLNIKQLEVCIPNATNSKLSCSLTPRVCKAIVIDNGQRKLREHIPSSRCIRFPANWPLPTPHALYRKKQNSTMHSARRSRVHFHQTFPASRVKLFIFSIRSGEVISREQYPNLYWFFLIKKWVITKWMAVKALLWSFKTTCFSAVSNDSVNLHWYAYCS